MKWVFGWVQLNVIMCNSPNGSSAPGKNASTLPNCQAQSCWKIPKIIANGPWVWQHSPKNIKVFFATVTCFPCTPQCQSLDICTSAQRMLNVKRCCKLHQNVLILSIWACLSFLPYSWILQFFTSRPVFGQLLFQSVSSSWWMLHISTSFTFWSPLFLTDHHTHLPSL